jgi:large subunit ribosomal protein L7/L12
MAKLSTDELLDAFKDMTLLELSEFVKKFEDTFEVTAAAPVAVAAAGPAAAAAEAPEEKDEFNVVLEAAGDKKIQVIKVVRELVSGLGLKEAKDLVESAPKPILEGVPKEAAEAAQAKLQDAGAKVSLAWVTTRHSGRDGALRGHRPGRAFVCGGPAEPYPL